MNRKGHPKMEKFDKLQMLLELAVMAAPDRTAVRHGSQQLSYGNLEMQTKQLGAGMVAQGVQPGDRVAWFMPNCLEAVLTTLACYRIGAISVPLNNRYVAEEARFVIEQTEPRLLLYHEDHFDVVAELLGMVQGVLTFAVAANESVVGHARFDDLFVADPVSNPPAFRRAIPP